MKGKIIGGIGTLATLITLNNEAKAQGPVEPFSPWGTVQDSVGNLVPDDTPLEARITGVDTIFTQLAKDGYYGFLIPAADSTTPGGVDGDTIWVYVESKRATPFLIWESGKTPFVPLTVDTSFFSIPELKDFEPYGTLRDSTGQSAPDNTELEARLEDLRYYDFIQNGDYSFVISPDDTNTTEKDGGVDGDSIWVYVNDKKAYPVLIWRSGGKPFTPLRIDTSFTPIDIKDEKIVPSDFKLYQNFPNPFNDGTTINYTTPKRGRVKITIYDINGRVIRRLVDKGHTAGNYQVQWDGKNQQGHEVSSGLYHYTLKTQNKITTKKMTLIK